MTKKYKIKCKICGDILEGEIPVKKEIRCSCGNVGLYTDYIAYNYVNKLPREDCYEDLNKENQSYNEVKKYYNVLEDNKKIKINKIQCNYCKDIIESKYTHDYKKCSCGRVAVDGGHEYIRRSFLKEDDYIELSEFED